MVRVAVSSVWRSASVLLRGSDRSASMMRLTKEGELPAPLPYSAAAPMKICDTFPPVKLKITPP